MYRTFVIMLLLAGLIPVSASLYALEKGDIEGQRGRIIFETFCLVCHGPVGEGDGPSAHALIPGPPSFKDPAVKESLTKEKVTEVITNGISGTQMEGFKDKLGPEEIQEVMEYIKTKLIGN
jgi:mono/diheme cytochrome c family protein